jgi:RNA polymerase sigma-70 factor (ECF subfamily)
MEHELHNQAHPPAPSTDEIVERTQIERAQKEETATLQELESRLCRGTQPERSQAFGEAIHLLCGSLLAFASEITGNWATAEDAVQVAAVDAWRAIAAGRFVPGNLKGWLFTIVRRRALDQVRARKRKAESPIDDHLDQVVSEAERERLKPAIRGAVEHCLEKLPNREREVLVLYLDGLSTTEIARILSTTEHAVRQAKSEGQKRLGECCRRRLKREDLL